LNLEEDLLEESYEPAGVSALKWESELRKQENRIKYKEPLPIKERMEIEKKRH